jgi:serine/threonine-protein kinase RsbW
MAVAVRSQVLDTVTGPATLDEIATTLQRSWTAHSHVPDSVRTQVMIAVAEIAANIVEHASRVGPVRVRMEVHVSSEQVRVAFLDNGPPVELDPNASPEMPHHMAERGRGLAMAHAVLDRLWYRRNVFNHWILVSRRFA